MFGDAEMQDFPIFKNEVEDYQPNMEDYHKRIEKQIKNELK